MICLKRFSRFGTLLFTLTLALALLLAGCGASASSLSEPASSASASSAASSQPQEPTATPTPPETPAPSSDGLEEILSGMLGFGPGTAGSSLSGMARAADLLNWSAAHTQVDEEQLTVWVTAWYGSCTQEERENLAESWPMVRDSAQALIQDPTANAPILEDAGASLDPAQPDSQAFDPLAKVLDTVILGESA